MYKPRKPPVILITLAVMLVFSVFYGLLENILGGSENVSAHPPQAKAAQTSPLPSTSDVAFSPAPSSTMPSGYVTYSSQGWLLSNWVMSNLEIKPAAPTLGQPVQVWANIYISDVPMSYIRAELLVNGQPLAEKQLVFWFDDPQDFYLSFTPAVPGEYDVVIRASMMENESFVESSGEDLSLYSSLKITVSG